MALVENNFIFFFTFLNVVYMYKGNLKDIRGHTFHIPHFKTNTPIGAQMGTSVLHNVGTGCENDN